MSIMPHIVCAIALRYSDKPEVYPIAMHFAKSAASSALVDGWKSVELCQAYILMSIYALPTRRWENDRSWLYTGLAIRCASLPQRAVYIESSKSNVFPMTELRQPESTYTVPESADNRTAETGIDEPDPDMDYLLQSGQVHRDAVWQAVDPERRLVRSFSS